MTRRFTLRGFTVRGFSGRGFTMGWTQLGWALGAAGALLCVLGWYGISGERFAERQIPYLASATVPGAALIVAGAVLLARPGAAEEEARRDRIGEDDRLRRQLALLYDLLVEEATRSQQAPGGASGVAARDPGSAAERLAYLPNGRTYHRVGCLLVEGRGDAVPVTPAGARERGLRPCPLCMPDQGRQNTASGTGDTAPDTSSEA
ncbi:hypothetical protein [Streptacidiphilus fuscans]|uniref:Uncharacterized protein n=1 Tax=Streptacidiphilus fuscans TaxID=2789292 RepID=A0A931FGR5_9ACTN|nr:hypothetical protein [Streptacidiphilus fuscans]MBF9071136.1 hypothetical protein [Streptacidiphilus fuscans]